MSKRRRTNNSKRNRQLRLGLFDSGNTKCPICFAAFNRTDVVTGKVTLEHAPVESLNGSVVCLTCQRCNSNASRIDQHAFLSKKAVDDWSSGRGASVEIDFFGRRTTSRYIPDDPKSPLPVRVRDLRKGSIVLGAMPSREHLDFNKGIRFRMPRIPHYERVSLVRSAYLMIFSLMGMGGYSFAENIALEPVRQQIMNPDKRILKGGFFLNGNMKELFGTDENLIALYRTTPACWMIPLGNNQVVILPCGGSEPIDEFVLPKESFSIPTNLFSYWVSCRFDSSVPLVGSVNKASGAEHDSLVGCINRTPSIAATGEKWHWIVVYHHNHRYVALPSGDDGQGQRAGLVEAVQMLNEKIVAGRGMDRSTLVGVNYKELSKERSIFITE